MSPPQAGREAIAAPCSPLGALRAHRGHPDRGIGVLHRFRTECDVVEAEVLPVMTEVVLGEAPLDNRQRLIRAPKGFCGGNAEQVAFRLLAAPPTAKSNRPLETRSTVAMSSAIRRGLWSPSSTT